MLKNVVFPAPFGPIRLTIEPSGTVKSTSSTATRPPNSFRSSSVWSSTSRTCDLRVVERHVEMRAEMPVDPGADVREAFAVEIREEARTEDDAPDVAHAAEDDHAE